MGFEKEKIMKRDGLGPNNEGAKTGRGLGDCVDNNEESVNITDVFPPNKLESGKDPFGFLRMIRGAGRGGGAGRGFRNRRQ